MTHVGIRAQSFISCVILGGYIPQKLNIFEYIMECVLVTQLCLILCDPVDCSPPSSVHGILQARILEWVAISYSKGIFPTQGLNPGLLHCRWTLYQLSHKHPNKLLCCESRSVASTLCDPMDYSLPGSSVHGVLQARILEWVAIPFSRGPRNRTGDSCTAGGFFTN